MKTEIIFAEISSVSDFRINDLLELVSSERRERIRKLRSDIDRKLSLYTELMVRYFAIKKLNISNKDIIFKKNRYGKPYLRNFPKFHFNLSHTRNAIAVAFSDKEIGIDIERIKFADFRIADRFFTIQEREYMNKSADKDYAFYKIWTRKEAYVKWKGIGFAMPPNSFDVISDDGITSIINTTKIDKYLISICGESLIVKEPSMTVFTEYEMRARFTPVDRSKYRPISNYFKAD